MTHKCTVNAFSEFGNDQRVGRIAVILHAEEAPEDEYCGNVIGTTRDEHATLQEGILVGIIDGHQRHADINELRKDREEEFN